MSEPLDIKKTALKRFYIIFHLNKKQKGCLNGNHFYY